MRPVLSAFAAGLLFGTGLVVSGMTDANKVIAFLDVGGAWDPSLALVMVGAIGVHMVAFYAITRQASPLFATAFLIPERSDLTPRLLGGAALFGVGWALGGFCPGPGFVSLMSFGADAAVFVVGLLGGFAVFRFASSRLETPSPTGVVDTAP